MYMIAHKFNKCTCKIKVYQQENITQWKTFCNISFEIKKVLSIKMKFYNLVFVENVSYHRARLTCYFMRSMNRTEFKGYICFIILKLNISSNYFNRIFKNSPRGMNKLRNALIVLLELFRRVIFNENLFKTLFQTKGWTAACSEHPLYLHLYRSCDRNPTNKHKYNKLKKRFFNNKRSLSTLLTLAVRFVRSPLREGGRSIRARQAFEGRWVLTVGTPGAGHAPPTVSLILPGGTTLCR